ncbi:MAG TPA: (2Fe-2S)-binding protein [Usitatibacteraceae bacterium]|nr:(2Fe-2S)-binding protein [Usitatibacteraceae bacterium]
MSTTTAIRFTLNGEAVACDVPNHWTVVELLQERFGLFGARESCGQGLCGCCTVVVDGKPVTGCLHPAAFLDGATLQTIEAEGPDGGLDAVQAAFVEAGAFQCGYCTPGFILAVRALLAEHPDPTDEQVRHGLAGNLCRCAAYPEIEKAVRLAAARLRAQA